MKDIVGRLRARIPVMRVIGATVVSALGGRGTHGSPEEDVKRKQLNEFIRNSGGLFDGVADFDKATLDPTTGSLREEFIPDSTTGREGDKVHPNRAGYLAIGNAVDLTLLEP